MHVLVPSGSFMIPVSYWGQSGLWWGPDRVQPAYFPFIVEGGYKLAALPTYWRATSGRKYNDVCHGKPTGYEPRECIPFFDKGQYFPGHVSVFDSSNHVAFTYCRYTNWYETFKITQYSYGSSQISCTLQWGGYYYYLRKRTSSTIQYTRYEYTVRIQMSWKKGAAHISIVGIYGPAFAAAIIGPLMSDALDSMTFAQIYNRGNAYFQRDYIMKRIDKLHGEMVGFMNDEAKLWGFSHRSTSAQLNASASSGRRLGEIDLPTVSPSSQIFHEGDVFIGGVDPLVVTGKSFVNYWRSYLISEAYYDACQNVPRLNENSVSNIMEIASFIKSLVVDRKVEMPRSLSEAWLSYRYQYCTGKMDVEEAIQFVHRHMDLQGVGEITSYGQSTCVVDSVDVTCRCCFHISPKDVGTLDRIWRALYTYGLQPNFYLIWDMIPYSFVVDWLIPIGDIASRMDASAAYSGTYYDIRDIQFSLSYDRLDDQGVRTHWYTRWCQQTPPNMLGVYAFEKDTSMRTTGFRALDLMSLLIK